MDTNTQALAMTVNQSASFIASEFTWLTYMVGYFLAFGMNWADKDTSWLGALLASLLSWMNVGFLLMSRHA